MTDEEYLKYCFECECNGEIPMEKTMICKAWNRGQEMYCNRCGFVWDMTDPEPPQCLTDEEAQARLNEYRMTELRENLNA